MIDFENIGQKFVEVVESPEWQELQAKFNNCNDIYILGHGGNLAVADHAAIDMTRLSGGLKNAKAPGSGVVATSLINDISFEGWMEKWLEFSTRHKTDDQIENSLVIGISSSGMSPDVDVALEWASRNGFQTAIISSQPVRAKLPEDVTQVVLNTVYYHTGEVLTLLLTYELTDGAGHVCPQIKGTTKRDKNQKHWRGQIREHSYPDEKVNVGIDFDGVIHKCSKGFYDGTIYDDPVDGVAEALKQISDTFNIIVFTCKAKADRPLVNGKTGTELVWEWLEKHDLAQFVSQVTAEKPRAKYYIDDRAIRFDNWETVLEGIDFETE